MTGRSRVRLANGRELSALDIEFGSPDRAKNFTQERPRPGTARSGMWERALSAIETGNLR